MYCFIMHLLDGGNFVKFSRVQLEFFVRFAIFTFFIDILYNAFAIYLFGQNNMKTCQIHTSGALKRLLPKKPLYLYNCFSQYIIFFRYFDLKQFKQRKSFINPPISFIMLFIHNKWLAFREFQHALKGHSLNCRFLTMIEENAVNLGV